tara:strand:+ start:209 stop:505 length:297 start_codon:yes stop_codon:yes gene_type:complete
MGINLNLINSINQFLLKDIKVDFTFLNLVSKKNLLLRLKKRKKLNRYDRFDIRFYNRVQKGFLKIAKLKYRSYQIINSNLEIKKNQDIVINQVQKLIK